MAWNINFVLAASDFYSLKNNLNCCKTDKKNDTIS